MMQRHKLTALWMVLLVAGCSQSGTPSTATASNHAEAVTSLAATLAEDAAAMAADPLLVVVHKNESCGCCNQWIEHLKQNGFHVKVRDVSNMGPIKEHVGIPAAKGSCHTGIIGDYFVEGHVPASDIRRFLAEHPDAKGLTVPGMPAGSPGMETPDGKVQPYSVLLVARDGSTSVFSHHGE